MTTELDATPTAAASAATATIPAIAFFQVAAGGFNTRGTTTDGGGASRTHPHRGRQLVHA